jgi:hypothetical protein
VLASSSESQSCCLLLAALFSQSLYEQTALQERPDEMAAA